MFTYSCDTSQKTVPQKKITRGAAPFLSQFLKRLPGVTDFKMARGCMVFYSYASTRLYVGDHKKVVFSFSVKNFIFAFKGFADPNLCVERSCQCYFLRVLWSAFSKFVNCFALKKFEIS